MINKQSALEQIKQAAFEEELEKIALTNPGDFTLDPKHLKRRFKDAPSMFKVYPAAAGIGAGVGAGVGSLAGLTKLMKNAPKKDKLIMSAIGAAVLGLVGGNFGNAIKGADENKKSIIESDTKYLQKS